MGDNPERVRRGSSADHPTLFPLSRNTLRAMPLYADRGKRPHVAPDAFVAPTAVLIGDVTIRTGASVWFGTVLRGDMDRIEIGERSNVQDNATIHTDENEPTI